VRTILLDIDGTLLPRSLEQWFLWYLLKSGRLRGCNMIKNFYALWQWPLRAQAIKLLYLRGEEVDRVQFWIEEAWSSEMAPRLYAGWQPAIQWLQDHNARLVLLSGTPMPLAQPLMRHFRIQEIICAEPEILNLHYTGRLRRAHPKSRLKLAYAEEWLKNNNIPWNETVAIANDWPDRFLLSQARAVVIHPSRRLLRLAQERRWSVVQRPEKVDELLQAITGHFSSS